MVGWIYLLCTITLKILLAISTFVLLLCFCANNKKEAKLEKLFEVSYHILETDTTIRDKQPFGKQSHKKHDFYGDLFLEDSTYQVYGCNMGEFGGSLFFYNKIYRKLFFYS